MFVRAAFAFAALFCVGSTFYAVSAQSPRATASSDSALTALVTELRAIRRDLADASQRSLRFQLLLARLQLQEQRIGHLDRQRAEIAKSLMDTGTMSAMFVSQFQQFEQHCENATADDRKACESQMAAMKATANSHQAREQQLRMQEQELTQAIAAEQGRWGDLSARLDELERALTRPQ
jgi:chromosome segregation ATPase